MADSMSMNPFQPGAGLLPGYMGHRPAIEQPLLEIVDRLRAGQNDPRLAYLYGPRGNGKTVLLRWLADQVDQKRDENPIVHVRLLPEHLTSSEALLQRIRSAVRQTPGKLDNLSVSLEAGIPGVSLKVGSDAPADPILGLSDWLDQDRYPVLFSLDEAHEADAIVLGRLLNAVQLAGQRRQRARLQPLRSPRDAREPRRAADRSRVMVRAVTLPPGPRGAEPADRKQQVAPPRTTGPLRPVIVSRRPLSATSTVDWPNRSMAMPPTQRLSSPERLSGPEARCARPSAVGSHTPPTLSDAGGCSPAGSRCRQRPLGDPLLSRC